MTFRERIEAALRRDNPSGDPAWAELEAMAESSPESAVDLISGIAGSSIAASQRGWLAAGPLRSAIAAANPAEERAMEDRAAADPTLAMLLDALVRYETKQRVVAELLEGTGGAGLEIVSDPPVTIPNVHEQTASQSLDQEAWSKIVKAIQAAPESQLFMLATTIVEPLLLRNESAFREAMLEQVRTDPVFRRTLSYCDLSFSETFLDELRDVASR